MSARIVFFVVLLAASTAHAAESITAGTIVIVAQARDYIIFAADSRVGSSNGRAVSSVDDTYCKIAPLGGNTLFSAAGIVTDPIRSWAADTEMDRVMPAFRPTDRMTSAEGASAIARWADVMAQRLGAVPRSQLIVYTQANGGVAAAGVLAGIDKNGESWVRVSKITCDSHGVLSHQETSVSSRGEFTEFFGLGQSEIAVVFDHGNTARAIAERAHWQDMNLSGREFDRFKARRLVELTIQYASNQSDVGGPVDEIELDAGGQHWIQAKPHCRQ